MVSKALLAFQMLADLENIERMVFFFKYPNFSKLMMVLLLFFILTFDPAYIMSYILGCFIINFIIQNDSFKKWTSPLLDFLIFNSLNPYIDD